MTSGTFFVFVFLAEIKTWTVHHMTYFVQQVISNPGTNVNI